VASETDIPQQPPFYRLLFTNLYRCWIQLRCGEVPTAASFTSKDGIVISRTFGALYTVDDLGDSDLRAMESEYGKDIVAFVRRRVEGSDSRFVLRGSDTLPCVPLVLAVLREYRSWIQERLDESFDVQREAYETTDQGRFAVWRTGETKRLILSPLRGEARYGYIVIKNAPQDFFFLKSKSAKEAGRKLAEGGYKVSEHRVETRRVKNIDLLYDSGEVALMHLTVAGAGYKAFPRQAPHPFPLSL
jgi:hypothetical protein